MTSVMVSQRFDFILKYREGAAYIRGWQAGVAVAKNYLNEKEISCLE